MPWRRMATRRAARKRFRGIHNGPSLPESGSALRNRWEHLSFGTTGGETTLELAAEPAPRRLRYGVVSARRHSICAALSEMWPSPEGSYENSPMLQLWEPRLDGASVADGTAD